MKYTIYLLMIVCCCITSCADDNLFDYQGNTVVRFQSTSTTLSENDDAPKGIVLVITSPDGKVSDVTATFEIEAANEAGQGDVYTLVNEGNTLNFTNGISDTIFISAKNNAEADGVKELLLKITTSNVGIGLSGDAANFSTHTVIINDDDCSLDIRNFAREYNSCEVGYQAIDMPVSLGSASNTIVVENLGDWGIADATLQFNPDVTSSEITILNTQAGVLGGTTAVFWSGTGKYVACTGDFQVSYQIVFADGSPWGPGSGTDVFTVAENEGCNPLF